MTTLLLCVIILLGEFMKIAVDKSTYHISKDKDKEYIYLFDDETLDELLKTNMHCVYYKKCDYVDINLTGYDIDCIKKAQITDKDYDKIAKQNYKYAIIIPNCNNDRGNYKGKSS